MTRDEIKGLDSYRLALEYLHDPALVWYWYNTSNKALLDYTPMAIILMGKEQTLIRIMRESIKIELPIKIRKVDWDNDA